MTIYAEDKYFVTHILDVLNSKQWQHCILDTKQFYSNS